MSSCLGRFSKKQLPSLFPLVTYGRMHGKRRTRREGVQPTTGRLGLGLLGLDGEALGSGALLEHDHDNQLFIGLGRRRVWDETARRTFNHLDFGDNG